MTEAEFSAEFEHLTEFKPFKWQTRLFSDWLSKGRIPDALDLPTGTGKTSIIALWYLARQAGAHLPRRLIYVVDRRVVVDQATEVAAAVKERCRDANLRVSTLRGRYVDNREWTEDPAGTAIIVGTVDMIGSRLLFSGYGVSRKMRPYHAGLLGVDCLFVVDEAHLIHPFHQLTRVVCSEKALRGTDGAELIPRSRVVSLSATGHHQEGATFRLNEEDLCDPVIEDVLEAGKELSLVPCGEDDSFAELAAVHALRLAGTKGRCLIYCNSRNHAEKSAKIIADRAPKAAQVELLVGARRVYEREEARRKLGELGFIAGSASRLDGPAFLVATSAGEVGIDIDADHLVCDLVSWERMVQRFGRVNRRGGAARQAHVIVIDTGEPSPKKAGSPTAAEAQSIEQHRSLLQVVAALTSSAGGLDVSPQGLMRLQAAAAENEELGRALAAATSPSPLRPALTRAVVDAWSMTSLPAHTGRPRVAPWLRGWVEEEVQMSLAWRRYLPVRTQGSPATKKEIETFFEAAPPHLSELLETEVWLTIEWLNSRAEVLEKHEPPNSGTGEGGGDSSRTIESNQPVAIQLTGAGDCARVFTLRQLAAATGDKRKRDQLTRDFAGATLVLDSHFAGLHGGLLDPDENDCPLTADAPSDGEGANSWATIVGFDISTVPPAVAEATPAAHLFPCRKTDEGEDLEFLMVTMAESEDARARASRPQLLDEHQRWAAEKATAIARATGLPHRLANIIELAARHHDLGKRNERWQRAFKAPRDGTYAKTRGPIDFAILDGYRHELGSVAAMIADVNLDSLPPEDRDLVLHLVAAHHGGARPSINTSGCDDAPPSELTFLATQIADRYCRLQRQWGPWVLAWLESLLRAADQQASRKNDQRTPPHARKATLGGAD